MKNLTILFATITVLASCSDHPYQKQIQKVDSLLVVVNDAEQILQNLSPNDYDGMLDTVSQDVKFIQNHYPDTMDLQTALKVDYYYRTIKSVSKFSTTLSSQSAELQYSKSQLKNMRQDLENEILNEESFEQLYPAEGQAVGRHRESVGNLKAWHETIAKTFNRHKPGIDSLIVYIKESAK